VRIAAWKHWASRRCSVRKIPSDSWNSRTCRNLQTSSSGEDLPIKSPSTGKWDSMTTSDAAGPRENTHCRMVFPNQTNHHGTLFGGDALRLMDMAAFVTASRHARRPVVTASPERIDFHVPVRQGQLAEVVGRVISTGEHLSRLKWNFGQRMW
jgi:Thioesterase superfamily